MNILTVTENIQLILSYDYTPEYYDYLPEDYYEYIPEYYYEYF